MMSKRWLVLWGLAAAMLAAPSARAAVCVKEFTNGIGQSANIVAMVAGPDGNMWFAQSREFGGGIDQIGRITPGGAVTYFSSGISRNSNLQGLTLAPDGNLWFTEEAGRIGRMTPAGAVTEFSSGLSGNADPQGIAAGPDGNLWFTEHDADQVARITPAGVVTEFGRSAIGRFSGLASITSGPDGNLWFVDSNLPEVGRITPAGAVTQFSGGIHGKTNAITVGPDGNLWFTEDSHRVGRITPDGAVTEFPDRDGGTGIAAGQDGNLWLASGFFVGRMSIRGRLSDYLVGPERSGFSVDTIAAGPGKSLWLTSYLQPSAIWRVSVQRQCGGGTLASTRAVVSRRGHTAVAVSCPSGHGRCNGAVSLVDDSPFTIAHATYSLGPGHRDDIELRLNETGRADLGEAPHHRLVVSGSAGASRQPVVLTRG